MAGETMEEKKKTEPILPPDIQRLIDEIEGVIPPEPEEQERKICPCAQTGGRSAQEYGKTCGSAQDR